MKQKRTPYRLKDKANRRRRGLLLIVTYALLGVATVTIVVRAYGPRLTAAREVDKAVLRGPASSLAQPSGPAEPIEVERITVLPTGFQPTEISRPKGKMLLAVDDHSGLNEIQLRLDQTGGNRLHGGRVVKKNPHWRSLWDLNPGSYLLTEANHPDWVCHITITAK